MFVLKYHQISEPFYNKVDIKITMKKIPELQTNINTKILEFRI